MKHKNLESQVSQQRGHMQRRWGWKAHTKHSSLMGGPVIKIGGEEFEEEE